jgi:hypothetical protein
MRFRSVLIFASFLALPAAAQVLTREDSLNAGLVRRDGATLISGYGEAKVTYDLRYKTGQASLTRNVLFVGHRFNSRISLFSELEVADAKVEGGKPGGEVSLEQVFMKFNLNRNVYLSAGLIIPRIGVINENHLPTTFNGNNRHFVETMIIPSTWRELGVAVYGQTPKIPGLNWSFGLFNGLNSSKFGQGAGIREGRFEGSEATATNVAVTGALLYYRNQFRFQVSAYYGGSAGLSPREADSLQLESGPFGTPVMLGEASVQYLGNNFTFKALGTGIRIPDAQNINRAYANNTPLLMWGAYAEAGYNVLGLFGETQKNLTVFVRYETLDLNAEVPENGLRNDFLSQQYIIGGVTWLPIRNVAVKADYVHRVTGEMNPALQINPFVNGQVFYASRGYVNVGIAYSF